MLTKNFKSEEFACRCGGGCDAGPIDMRLVRKLQEVRDLLGEPIKINSGLRCSAHNEAIKGNPHSAHLYAFAGDIAIPSSSYRFNILPLLISRFTRIGIGPDFIHVDVDDTKPQDIIWTY